MGPTNRFKIILLLFVLVISLLLISSLNFDVHHLGSYSEEQKQQIVDQLQNTTDTDASNIILKARRLIERAGREERDDTTPLFSSNSSLQPSNSTSASLSSSFASSVESSSAFSSFSPSSSSSPPSSSASASFSSLSSSSFSSSFESSSHSSLTHDSSSITPSSSTSSSSSALPSSSEPPSSSTSSQSSSVPITSSLSQTSQSVFTTLSTNSDNEKVTVTVTQTPNSASSASPSPSLSTANKDSNSSGGGLSSHDKVIVGCVVGIVVPFLLVLAFLAYWFGYKKRSSSSMNSQNSGNDSITSFKNEDIIGDSLSHTGEHQTQNNDGYDVDELMGNTYRGSSRVNPSTNF